MRGTLRGDLIDGVARGIKSAQQSTEPRTQVRMHRVEVRVHDDLQHELHHLHSAYNIEDRE